MSTLKKSEKVPINILQHKIKTCKVNGTIKLTLPIDFCRSVGIDGSEGEHIVILVLERHKGKCVNEFNEVFIKD